MILSFHPIIEGDKNRLCAGRDPDNEDLAAIASASMVILPQGCRESLYKMAVQNAAKVFPDYNARFKYPGKVGQAGLFKNFGAAHPHTMAFDRYGAFLEKYKNTDLPPIEFPCVFKLNWGGEGESVFLLENQSDFQSAINMAQNFEAAGQFGFLFQQYIQTNGRSLRVVVLNETIITYWRVASKKNPFCAGISKGGTIDHESDKHLMALAKKSVQDLCEKTGINLAGFDLVFNGPDLQPLFLEINFFFGRQGLGGSKKYYKMLEQAISAWIQKHA